MSVEQRVFEKQPSLGVVAISYNEEVDLPGFLANLLPWVDEIVIVDDGSSDKTRSIAEAAGDKVKFIVSPRGAGEYYAGQRNKGIVAAESDWLLHMDIDERVTPELAVEIIESIRNEERDGFRFRRLNFFLHRPVRGGGWQNWNMVHLARRQVLRFEGMFHERCVLNVPEKRIGQLNAKMWHLNDDSYKARMRKSFSYCQELSERLEKKFKRIGWIHILGLPVLEFFRKYLLKCAYRDGVRGLIFSMHSAGAMFRGCALVWDRRHRIPREEVEEKMRALWQESKVGESLRYDG